MSTKQIRAIEVKEGQTVTAMTIVYTSLLRKRKRPVDQGIRPINGRWPTVTKASYLENGEGGQPTVYLEMSDKRGWTHCLAPDDQVTVEVA